MSVTLPPETIRHNVENFRGLMLADVLKRESIELLLGCSTVQAEAFQADSRTRMEILKRAVLQARSPRI